MATTLEGKPLREPFWAVFRNLLLRYGVLAILVALIVFLALTAPSFFTVTNLLFILQNMAVETLIALGVTVSVVVNGFDVSVGANAGTVVILSMIAMIFWQWSLPMVLLLVLVIGLAVGAINSGLIVGLRLPDLLATLGMLFVLDGFQQIVAGGQTITQRMTLASGHTAPGTVSKAFLSISRGNVYGIPTPIIILVVVSVLLWVFLERTRWGRIFYAVGSNPEAARLVGVRVNLVRTAAYLMSGTLAALGGLLLAARLGLGTQLAGDPYMLTGVAATMIGFAMLGAGRANVLGTLVGALLMAVISNGFTMLNVPYYTQQAIFGLLMLVALALSFVVRRR